MWALLVGFAQRSLLDPELEIDQLAQLALITLVTAPAAAGRKPARKLV
jgi:hypothetical protein